MLMTETTAPELILAVNARRALRAELLSKIACCTDADVMVSMLVPELDLATREGDMKALRNDIKAAVQAKLKSLGGAKPTAADMREMFPDMVKKAKGSFSMTHYGVAQRVVAETDGDLRYNIDQDKWMTWDGRRWMTLRAAQVATIARTAANKAKADAANDPNVDIGKLDVVDSDGFRRGVVGEMLAAERMHVEQRDLNAEVRYLACGNGAVDLYNGSLVRQRDLLVTVRNDTDFNPNAACPTFLQVLRDAFEGRNADIAYYELVMGYTLQGAPTERAMFFHKGEGLNGKSLLLGAIMKAIGDYAAAVSYKVIADAPGSTMNTGADGASPALRRLMDKRMAYIDELPLGGNLRDADVKLLAGGGGTVSARGLGKEAVEFPVTFVFHIACNSLPTIRGGQSAVWKRTYPIAFTKQFDKVEDPTLPAKLEAEREGIFAWLVSCGEKYAAVHAQGGKLRDFMPQSALDELATLQSEQNPFTDWVAANCEVVQGAFMPVQEGWEDYVAYEAKVNLDGTRSVRSTKAFTQRMKEYKIGAHVTQYGKGRQTGFLGIRLKSDMTPVESPPLF